MTIPSADAESPLARTVQALPEAGDLLSLLAFLAPEPVPLAMIEAGADLLPDRLAAAVRDAARREAMYMALVGAGLAAREDDELEIDADALRAARERLDEAGRKRWAEVAAEVALQAYPKQPEQEEAAEECGRLLPHAVHAAESCAAEDVATARAASLFGLTGRFELTRGNLDEARRLLERALPLRERAQGPAHPLVAFDLTYLNGTLAKDPAERPRMVENARRALEILERAHGAGDRTVIVHVNNVGTLLRGTGNVEGARAHFERAQALAAETYGTQHPFFATITSNLGDTLQEQGDLAGARERYETALAADEAAYGVENRSVARDAHKLAKLLARLGEDAAARPLFERSLAFWAGQVGADHPFCASIRDEIAALGDG